MYCNSYEKDETGGVPNNQNVDQEQLYDNAYLRVIPYLLTRENQHFDIKDCRFNMEQYKASSAR